MDLDKQNLVSKICLSRSKSEKAKSENDVCYRDKHKSNRIIQGNKVCSWDVISSNESLHLEHKYI